MRHNFEKEICACSISGFINRNGERTAGDVIIRSIRVIHDRGNGLGGGFAAYGIYPEFKEQYAFHLMFETETARRETEKFLETSFDIVHREPIPTRPVSSIHYAPILWRYFANSKGELVAKAGTSDDDFVVRSVMDINAKIQDAFVFSSGKNMGVFKGVGFPEEIGEFFKLEEYEAYIWTAHGRFPTNSKGWWGGAHPFSLLDWTIVHNGEISSYGINKRYLEMFGYKCTLYTDTEVVAYMLDLLVRRHGLSIRTACTALASPFWKDIERMPADEQEVCRALRMVYGSALLNGPFAFLFAFGEGLVGFNDRIKLRPLVVGEKGDSIYMASEECAIREICPDAERVWYPQAGEPVIARLESGVLAA